MENGTISAIFLGDNGDLTFYFYSRSKSLSVQERRLKMSRMCQKRNEKRFLLVNTPMQIPLIALARMIRGMQQTWCKCNLQDICLVCQQSKIEFSYKAYKPKTLFKKDLLVYLLATSAMKAYMLAEKIQIKIGIFTVY